MGSDLTMQPKMQNRLKQVANKIILPLYFSQKWFTMFCYLCHRHNLFTWEDAFLSLDSLWTIILLWDLLKCTELKMLIFWGRWIQTYHKFLLHQQDMQTWAKWRIRNPHKFLQNDPVMSGMMASWNGNISSVTGHFCVPGKCPALRPVTQSFDVLFDLHLNKGLRKQSWGCWFETLSCPLWRHCNGLFNRQHSFSEPMRSI